MFISTLYPSPLFILEGYKIQVDIYKRFIVVLCLYNLLFTVEGGYCLKQDSNTPHSVADTFVQNVTITLKITAKIPKITATSTRD